MKKPLIIFVASLIGLNVSAQPNCEVYKDDEACYQACKKAMKAIQYAQGSYQSQAYFDESITLCPTFAYSYMEKAVPFLKRGEFVEWKRLIDKAVELAPIEYLGYRGWCRLQFLRDYEGCIKDIEQLKQLIKYDIGYCQTGDYHLNIALALCYKALGNIDRARALFTAQLISENPDIGLFDFYHFGVLEYEAGNHQQAIDHLNKQIEVNDYLGETYYFLAMANKKLGNVEVYRSLLDKGVSYYNNGKFRVDNYTETMDKIYLIDIVEEQKASMKLAE